MQYVRTLRYLHADAPNQKWASRIKLHAQQWGDHSVVDAASFILTIRRQLLTRQSRLVPASRPLVLRSTSFPVSRGPKVLIGIAVEAGDTKFILSRKKHRAYR